MQKPVPFIFFSEDKKYKKIFFFLPPISPDPIKRILGNPGASWSGLEIATAGL